MPPISNDNSTAISIELSARAIAKLEERKRKLLRTYKPENSLIRGGCPVRELVPKRIVEFEHEGPLSILAFSDYRIHEFEPLLEHIKNAGLRPDLIVYAGDDIDRFAPVPLELLSVPSRSEGQFPPELQSAEMNTEGWLSARSTSIGYILRVPSHLDQKAIRNRVDSLAKLGAQISRAFFGKKATNYEAQLEELLASAPLPLQVKRDSKNNETRISIIDLDTSTEVFSVKLHDGLLFPDWFASEYWNVGRKLVRGSSVELNLVRSDDKWSWYHIALDPPQCNLFEELAQSAKYGMAAVIGNDDGTWARAWIRGKNVYELHNTLLRIGSFLFVGVEGSTCIMGRSLEADVMLRLEFTRERSRRDDKIVIISHSPPRGILDRAMRFGDEAIGSIALRDFIENEPGAGLVICGHVHRCGGESERLNNSLIANVSSHDDPFSQANLMWLTVEPNGEVQVQKRKLPSLIETISTSDNPRFRFEKDAHLTKGQTTLFIAMIQKHGRRLFERLDVLAHIKFHYGLSWNHVFTLLEHGVESLEDLTDEAFQKLSECHLPGDHLCFPKAYAKFKRESNKGKPYLTRPTPLTIKEKLVAFDTEYTPDKGVLYGFLDLTNGRLQQFWFDEKENLTEYLARHRHGYVFVHWGGRDKQLLRELKPDCRTVNLLYCIQVSLIAPIKSATLVEVYDCLVGHNHKKSWDKAFYEMDGFWKLGLCNRILRNPKDRNSRRELGRANKVDVIALCEVLKDAMELPVNSLTHD